MLSDAAAVRTIALQPRRRAAMKVYGSSPTCRWPWGCMKPPITPKTAYRRSLSPSSEVAAAGMMVWYGRLCGARQLGWSSSKMKLAPRFCRGRVSR